MNKESAKFKRWVRGYARKYWYLIALSMLFGVVAVGIGLLGPIPMKFLADYVFGNVPPPDFIAQYDKQTLLLGILGAYILLSLFGDLYGSVTDYIGIKFNQIIDREVVLEAFTKINSLPVSHPARKDNGTYVYQINDQAEDLSGYIMDNPTSIFLSLVALLGVFGILASIDLRMTLMCFISVPILALLVIKFTKRLEKQATETENAFTKMYEYITESLEKLRTIQIFSKEKYTANLLRQIITVKNRKVNRQTITNEAFDISSSFVTVVITCAVLLVGGLEALNGKLTFGDLLLFISYMDDIFSPITNIADIVSGAKQQRISLMQVFHSMQLAESLEAKAHVGTAKPPKIEGVIEFRDVTYKISDRTILDRINVKFEPHSINALAGPSGQGKSTIFNLLLGFLQPTSGQILIDGVPIKDYDIHYLREHMSVVDQEADIFSQTVAYNIAYARADQPRDPAQVIKAAKVANSSNFINQLDEGYETKIDDESLSGGQKQRLSVARAYYKNSPIVLMDEPTSALDEESTNKFMESVRKRYTDKTIIMITHNTDLLRQIEKVWIVNHKHVSLRPSLVSHEPRDDADE